MSSQSGAEKRPIDTVANIAVVLAISASLVNLVVGMTRTGDSRPNALGLLLLVVIVGAYVIVIKRAPTLSRWVYCGGLASLLSIAYFAALNDSGEHRSTSALPLVLVTLFLICLPLLYMRLRTPKIRPQAKDES
jgi:hypothetical protein